MTNEEVKTKVMSRNIKLIPPYFAMTWDIFFFYAISTMFLSQVKGFSFSQIVALDSFKMLFGCLMCVPVAKLFQKFPSLNSTRLGLLGYGLYLILMIVGKSYITFVLAQLAIAFGYCINAIKVNTFLSDTLSSVKRSGEYQKVFGKGLSIYYIVETITAILAAYLYDWNPYVALWLAFGIVVISELYSLLLKDPNKFQKRNVKINSNVKNKKNKKNAPNSYFKILFSTFLIATLIYIFTMRGVLSIAGTGFKIFLQNEVDAGFFPIRFFGYVYAISKVLAAITSKFQFKLDIKYNIKTLINFGILTILTFIINGCLILFAKMNVFVFIAVVIVFCVQYATTSPMRIFVSNYIRVCINEKDIEKAQSMRTMAEYLGFAAISALFALLLEVFNNNLGLVYLVYIAIFAIPVLVTTIFFVRSVVRTFTKRFTIVKDEYTKE